MPVRGTCSNEPGETVGIHTWSRLSDRMTPIAAAEALTGRCSLRRHQISVDAYIIPYLDFLGDEYELHPTGSWTA